MMSVANPRWDISPDGKRFLINSNVSGDQASVGITMVVNWKEELDR